MTDSQYQPLWDDHDDHAPGILTWCQAWYASQCNGDWEHQYGVKITTLDNPGWTVQIDLNDTALAGRTRDRNQVHRSEHDWIALEADGQQFTAACGPLNLGEALHEFRLFAENTATSETSS